MAASAPPAEVSRATQAEHGRAAGAFAEGTTNELPPISAKLARELHSIVKQKNPEGFLKKGAEANQEPQVKKAELDAQFNVIPANLKVGSERHHAWTSSLVADYDRNGGTDRMHVTNQDQIVLAMYDSLNADPNFRALYSGQDINDPDSGVRAALMEYLGSDVYKTIFRKTVNERTGKPIVSAEKVAELQAAKQKETEAQAELDKAKASQQAQADKLVQIRNRETNFTRTPTGGVSEAAELDNLTGQLGSLNTEVAGLKATQKSHQDALEKKYALLQSQPRGVDTKVVQAEIAQLEAQEKEASHQLNVAQSKIDRQLLLQQKKDAIEADKISNIAEHKKLIADKVKLQANYEEARNNFENQETLLINGVNNFVDNTLEQTFGEAALKLYAERIAANTDTVNKLLGEQAAKETDEATKILLGTRFSRYQIDKGQTTRDKLFRKRTVYENQDLAMERDLEVVFNGGGPVELIRTLLTEKGMDPAAIETRLRDPEFMATMQNEVLHQLISAVNQTEAPLGSVEENKLATTEWGKAYLNRGATMDTEAGQKVRDKIVEAVAKGNHAENDPAINAALESGNYAEVVAKLIENGKNPNLIMAILMILGSIPILAISASMSAAQSIGGRS